jgi:lipopolysaccharide export system protein LptA
MTGDEQRRRSGLPKRDAPASRQIQLRDTRASGNPEALDPRFRGGDEGSGSIRAGLAPGKGSRAMLMVLAALVLSMAAHAADSGTAPAGTPQVPPPAAVPATAPAKPPPRTVQGQAVPGQNIPGQNIPGQNIPGQNLLGVTSETGGAPVTIEADQGIEWDQDAQRYIARGNAKAVRGTATVYGQVLTAYYRKTPSGGSDIWRLEAQDDIKIASPNGLVVGDRAIYDVDSAIFVITGKKLSLTSPKVTVTARDSMEYYQQKQFAVARGDAVAVKEDRTIRADVLEAHFKPDRNNDLQLTNLEAFDHVLITTPTAVARGLYGNYDFESGIAALKGSVKITRGQDQLDGDCAEVNTATGVSRIFPCGTANEQVRGLLVPRQGEGGKTPGLPPLPAASAGGTKSGGSASKSSAHGKMKPTED